MQARFFTAYFALLLIGASSLPRAQEPLSRDEALEVTAAVHRTFESSVYDKKVLQDPHYVNARRRFESQIKDGQSKKDIADAFNKIWANGPFSHVQMSATSKNAEQTANFLDNLKVGANAVSLSWRDDIPILTVNTMMGIDTIAAIRAAFIEITSKNAKALIIDLTRNTGGAFAVVPLVGHLIEKDVDSGFFVSQTWNRANATAPTMDFIETLAPWSGWSIQSFWSDAQKNSGVLRIRFSPEAPSFKSPVYILTSSQTASAAEMAVDALIGAKRVTHIGEKTAGKMLSQKMFDIPHGFSLSIPIADYISHNSGRIEGHGLTPSVAVDSKRALDAALAMAKGSTR